MGFLVYFGLKSGTATFTVSEFLGQKASFDGKLVRVDGLIAPGSVVQKPGDPSLKFTVVEGNDSLLVAYSGVVPDTFKEGNEVVVEGTLDSTGTFQAKTLMPRCPSKYEPQ